MQKSDFRLNKWYGVRMIALTTTALESGISFDVDDKQIMPFISGGIDFSYVDGRYENDVQ